ncbi:MAG: MarR family winged helix-turn-helix transcriptional regulator [Pseudomonadota bacterium]
MTAFDLDSFLPYRLSLLAHRASRGFAAYYRDAHDLNNAEWRVLAHLSQAPLVSVREIQQRTELEKSTVSRAVARLEDRGQVQKAVDPEDNRLCTLTLTAKGKRLMRTLSAAAARYQAAALGALSPAQQREIERALANLTQTASLEHDAQLRTRRLTP